MAHYHGYQRTDGSIQQRILPLLTPIWEDHELNDISFLKADTFSWQNGSVYRAVYQHLESDIFGKTLTSETISGITIQYYLANDGHKICPASEENNVDSLFNLVGVAKYFILDTDNTRFKVYREKYNKYSTELPVKGNGMALGLSNGTRDLGAYGAYGTTTHSDVSLNVSPSALGLDVGTTFSTANTSSYSKVLGVNTDSTKSGIISSSVSDDDMILYFYVGEFTQSAMANTAGINAETLNGKLDLDVGNATPVTKHNVNTWSCPSSKKTDLTLLASDSTYTMPANGQLTAIFNVSGTYSNAYLERNGVIEYYGYAGGAIILGNTIRVKKGDIVKVHYSAQSTITKNTFKFTYLEGEV